MSERPPKAPPRRSARDARTRERIVEAFTERARTLGPRSVVMAELARDLGISTRTLYRHFRAKADLMHEVMERFSREWRSSYQYRIDAKLSVLERLRIVTLAWLEVRDRFSPTFWRETRKQYPEAYAIWQENQRAYLAAASRVLLPAMRDDVPKRLSTSILFSSIALAADPDRCDRLGLSRQEAVSYAVDLWARGALKRADLRVVPDPAPEPEPT